MFQRLKKGSELISVYYSSFQLITIEPAIDPYG